MDDLRFYWTLIVVLSSVVLLNACGMSAKVTQGADGAAIGEAQGEAYDGPKARIAVGTIIDKSGASGKRSLSRQVSLLKTRGKQYTSLTVDSVTSGIKDMLTTALFDSNRYIVLEREAIKGVMVEQEFSASGKVGTATRIPVGQLEGAELLVVGAITGFDAGQGGGAFPVPIPLNRNGDFLVLNVSIKKSFVAMDLRVIDTRTARIVASVAVEGAARKAGATVSGFARTNYGHVHLPGLLSGFVNTPVEKAMQEMVNTSVDTLVANTPTTYFHYEAPGKKAPHGNIPAS